MLIRREKYLKIIKETIGKDKDLTIEDLKEFVSKYYHCNQFFNSLREMADKLEYPDNGDNYDDIEWYTDGCIKADKPYICFEIAGAEFYPEGLGEVVTECYVQYDEKQRITSAWLDTGLVLNSVVFSYFLITKNRASED